MDVGNVARIHIRKIGSTPTQPQFFRRLGIAKDTLYTLSFKLRASKASTVAVRVSQDHNPWSACGLRTVFDVTEEWKDYSCVFVAEMSYNFV